MGKVYQQLLIQDFCKFSDLVSEVAQLPSPPVVDVVTSVVYFEKAYNSALSGKLPSHDVMTAPSYFLSKVHGLAI